MSAFIVSTKHLRRLVNSGIRWGGVGGLRWMVPSLVPEWTGGDNYDTYTREMIRATRKLDHTSAGRTGAMLHAENVLSVDHRYDEQNDEEPYVHDHREFPKTPVEALKLLACYEYQTCEHEGWKQSEAFAFCSALRRALIDALPGYDAAPWDV